ncbi:MAG: hypothetical protein IPG47_13670 [Thermoflexaceae bacterium]|nr:hypothetical protein [Thermoflexaceae bacterium]
MLTSTLTIRPFPTEAFPVAPSASQREGRAPFWLLAVGVLVRGSVSAVVASMPAGRHARGRKSPAWTMSDRAH